MKTSVPVPARMAGLPLDKHGRPVPRFVAWIDGQPDHRVVEHGRFLEAARFSRCWLCGSQLGRYRAFVIGPMCAINRVSAEPPSHRECAVYAAQACPFMANPAMVRREKHMPADAVAPAGVSIRRNPGVTLVWITRRWRYEPDGDGWIVRLDEPEQTLWYAEGRDATRDEVLASIDSGLPILQAEAERDPRPEAALAELAAMHVKALKFLPEAAG